jgi:putative tryptophan/tyrosine transport system substrate-binding protein
MMNRRRFLDALAIGALATTRRAAKAQPTGRIRRIGNLSPSVADDAVFERESVLVPLRELGWIEGQNLAIERRYASGREELLRPFAEELVQLKVELVVTNGTAAARAVKNASASMSIVMYSAGDPVAAGLVASLAHPGGNVTGSTNVSKELFAKRLELLHELLPTATRVGELVNRAAPTTASLSEYEQVYRSLGMQPIFVDVAAPSELENAVAEVARKGGQALIVLSYAFFPNNRDRIMRAALTHALPTVVDTPYMLEAGGLLFYDMSLDERGRRTAGFIDKILRGAKPGDLPVEQPTKFELGINLKTAKALGLTVPQSLLLRADPGKVIR